MPYPFLVFLLLAFAVTYLSMPLVRRIGAAAGLLDHPDRRKMQRAPIPRTGGISVLLGLSAGTALLSFASADLGVPLGKEALAIGLGALIIHLVGVLDDLKNLPPLGKLFAQSIAVAVAMSQGIVIESIALPGGVVEMGWLAWPLTAFFLLGFINSINLIDGLDGLASGIVATGAFVLAIAGVLGGNFVLAGLGSILFGATLGFIPWNFREDKKTFLGDAGSMLLGYSLGVTAIAGAKFSGDATALWIVLATSVFPILDTATTIFRRARSGKALFRPDSMHMHHRMIRFGFTPKRTVLTVVLVTLFAGSQTLVMLVDGTRGLLVASSFAVGLAILGMWKVRPKPREEGDAGFREIVSYLLGAQDGHTARMRGDLSLVDILGDATRTERQTPAEEKIVPIHRNAPAEAEVAVEEPAPVGAAEGASQ